jgi:hypothetical protein
MSEGTIQAQTEQDLAATEPAVAALQGTVAKPSGQSSSMRKENGMSAGATGTIIDQPAASTKPGVAVLHGAARGPVARLSPTRGRVVTQTVPCPTCGIGDSQNSGPPTFIFAMGQVRMRFPSPSIEKEFAQTLASDETARLTDQAVLHNALKEYHYLANEVCWVFTVDSVETYILAPRDDTVLDQLVEAIKPAERGLDIDVIIGTRGPMAPPEMCNGLIAPIVLVDRIYSFDKPELIDALKKPAGSQMTDEEFRQSADALFDRSLQMAENVGATDEHRAVNYLAVRYPQIYTQTADMFARDFSLTRLEVSPSNLAGTRKLVNVIFTYTNRKTDVEEKYRVRVDVTEKYPFLEKRLSPYFDRD